MKDTKAAVLTMFNRYTSSQITVLILRIGESVNLALVGPKSATSDRLPVAPVQRRRASAVRCNRLLGSAHREPRRVHNECVNAGLEFLKIAGLEFPSSNVRFGW